MKRAWPLALGLALLGNASPATPLGFVRGEHLRHELAFEQQLLAIPSAKNAMEIEHHLSSLPHLAGSTQDYATVQFVADRLKQDGFQVRIFPYKTNTIAPESSLEEVAPQRVTFDLLEGDPAHHTAYELLAGPPYVTESGSGDVTGALYSVGEGSSQDFAKVDSAHVDLRGTIAIVQGGYQPGLYQEMLRRGVAGVILYNRSRGSQKTASRGGGITPQDYETSPLGYSPSTRYAAIPELLVTPALAARLLSLGNVRVHMKVDMHRAIRPIWDVVGTLTGSDDAGQGVMIGAHRDAVTFGAIDNGSGTTMLLQDADAFAKLWTAGWRPRRTIQLASWDGEELGLYGSASYGAQFADELRKGLALYINADEITTGNTLNIRATPGTWKFIDQIAQLVPGPAGSPLSEGAREMSTPNGSDHNVFESVLGIPSSMNMMMGYGFGFYHSAEDNLDALETYDPGMKEAVAMAQLSGIEAMRAADADVVPFRIGELPAAMLALIGGFIDKRLSQTVAPLTPALQAYQRAADAIDTRMDEAVSRGDVAAMRTLREREMNSRGAFYVPEGLSYNHSLHQIDRFEEIAHAFRSHPERIPGALAQLSKAISAATLALQTR